MQVGDYNLVTLLAKGWVETYKFSIPFSFFGDIVACFPPFPCL